MKEPPFLPKAKVAILGLGLMGGSLALALRGKCAAVLGVDPDPGALALAAEINAVDRAAADPAEILAEANVVVLATPVRAILTLLEDLPRLHPGKAMVLDLGSTKTRIVEAMQGLPERFDPLGGHPMCGKEKATLAHAEAGLFQGAPFAFTPLERSSTQARSLAQEMAEAIGARPVWLEAGTHDRWTAATSHLPYVLACALAAATPAEAAPLAATGFRSATRLALTPPQMMADVVATNRENLLVAARRFGEQFEKLEALLVTGDDMAIFEWLAQSRDSLTDFTALTHLGAAL